MFCAGVLASFIGTKHVPAEPDSCKTRSFTFVMRCGRFLRETAQVFMVAFLLIMKTRALPIVSGIGLLPVFCSQRNSVR
ncbi:hypothetical protein CJO09_15315 [Neopusillimonas maritima]|jgi:hypothetical protein|uniref:Uncharacterized protein n=1 Tax=Neopusillimonas maritima TaxID=2026239 RepID=A0A3A1YP53_9BURK|nr:hypothetical protein CJO09_15315 [Neopusillimonas maritima]RIY39018.1 hypothetical protein CJP73_15730 [Neopusillimonas maritima]|tara:strand:- start:3246 stop:3482 length:237 start_codon:yes stop_codon:yes gene_type:complete